MKNKGITIFLIILVIAIVAIVAVNLNGKGEESSSSSSESTENSKYSVTYKNVDITPGTAFDETKIQEQYSYSEINSCAFEGKDKVYTYSGAEINVANVNGVDTVYSVYFFDTETKTPEGIGVSDTKEDMIKAYGDNYKQTTTNSYNYTDGKIDVSFILQNDVIISIEYTLIVSK